MSSVKRQAHVLRPEKSLAIPRHVIFFDTETNMVEAPDGSVSHTLKLGWACYLRKPSPRDQEKQDWIEFRKPQVFWDFVLTHCTTKNKLWVIAHQLAFDFTVVEGFQYLYRAGFTCKFFYASGMTSLIRVSKRGSSIAFVDSLNWFRESLESIGERIDLPKMSVDFETVDDSALSAYCHRDVEILIGIYKRLVQFLETNRISRLCYTIGSTAMAAYLFRHYRQKIYIHNNAEAIALERAAYKGGRTECFFLGELTHGPYYVLDVNSLYSFVMRGNYFPVKYEKILHKVTVSDLAGFLSDRAVVARVDLVTTDPVFAVRSDRTIFPVGEFSVCLTSPELSLALRKGWIRGVTAAVVYERGKIFTSYVNRFYTLRREFASAGNPLFEHFCKVLLNSLYGKFGQKGQVWKKIGLCPGEPDRVEDLFDPVQNRRRQIRYLLGEVFELTGFEESQHSFPAIAAHVTAYARLYLWRLLQKAGTGNYYYCDTDSLFVNQAGLDNLAAFMHPTDLGKLKVEKRCHTLTLYGLKDYIYDDTAVLKGIRRNAVKLSDVDYRQESWPSLQGVLRGQDTSVYTTAKIEKHLSREYTKGGVTAEGWTVPFYLDGFVEPQ